MMVMVMIMMMMLRITAEFNCYVSTIQGNCLPAQVNREIMSAFYWLTRRMHIKSGWNRISGIATAIPFK